MVQFASYLRRVLCKTRLIFPRINGPIVFDKGEERNSRSKYGFVGNIQEGHHASSKTLKI